MADRAFPFQPWCPKDCHADIDYFTLPDERAQLLYRHLMDAQWMFEGSLPSDTDVLFKAARVSRSCWDEWSALILGLFFDLGEDGRWRQSRVARDYDALVAKRRQAQDAQANRKTRSGGRNGGRQRRNPTANPTVNPTANPAAATAVNPTSHSSSLIPHSSELNTQERPPSSEETQRSEDTGNSCPTPVGVRRDETGTGSGLIPGLELHEGDAPTCASVVRSAFEQAWKSWLGVKRASDSPDKAWPAWDKTCTYLRNKRRFRRAGDAALWLRDKFIAGSAAVRDARAEGFVPLMSSWLNGKRYDHKGDGFVENALESKRIEEERSGRMSQLSRNNATTVTGMDQYLRGAPDGAK